VAGRERYASQLHCPIARALEVVCDRWTFLVLRDLARGPQRFSRLRRSLSGISATLLSDRLQRLEAAGMITRVFYSEHPPRAEYMLTAKGEAFLPVLRALRDFGTDWVPLAVSPGAGTMHEPRASTAEALEPTHRAGASGSDMR